MPAPAGEPEPITASLVATDGPDTASFTATVEVATSIDYGFVKHAGAWVQPSKVYVKNAGSWIEPTSIFVKKGGVWTLVKGTP